MGCGQLVATNYYKNSCCDPAGVAPSRSNMVIGQERMIELAKMSFIGCFGSVALHAAVVFYRGEDVNKAIADVEAPSDHTSDDMASPFVVAGWSERLESFIQQYWQPLGLYLLLVLLELVKGLDQGSLSFLRVIKLESFRETMRGVVQGNGLPPLPEEERDQDEDAAAAQEAEYANAWAAKKGRVTGDAASKAME